MQLSLSTAGVDRLIAVLRDRGYEVVGPRVRDGAVVMDPVDGVADLPAGWTDAQEAGTYRLERRDDDALFGFATGPASLKRYLFPERSLVFRAKRTGEGFEVDDEPQPAPRYALIGLRGCDLAALDVLDRVFLRPGYEDPIYLARREDLFVVAVDCHTPGGTCFCVSMGTGPGARGRPGYDIALSELLEGGHRFLADAGSDRGAEVLASLPHAPATPEDEDAADRAVELAAQRMGRTLDTQDLPDLLKANMNHPRWDEVADRCLACTNCTLVCPTCFCASVEDATDLTGEVAERWRRWDSCFTLGHSYLHGGSVRTSTRARYRQWLTHKLGTWWDQFDTSGCVGCGRCITWCPVGIDITEEAAAIRGAGNGS